MRKTYEKYTEHMNGGKHPYIITPTYEYFENNTIDEIELIVDQYPNIFDYKYILDRYAVEDSIQGFNTFNEAVEALSKLDSKNWEQAQKGEARTMKLEKYAIHKGDYNIINKLMKLENVDTFNEDVRKLTKRVTSDRSIGRWQVLSEIRYGHLGGKTE